MTFKTFNELYENTENNKVAMVNDIDTMDATFGSTCKFFPIKNFQIDDSKWSIYSQDESPYISILNYQ